MGTNSSERPEGMSASLRAPTPATPSRSRCSWVAGVEPAKAGEPPAGPGAQSIPSLLPNVLTRKAASFLIEALLGANEARGMPLEPVGIVLEPAQAGDDGLGRLVQYLDGEVHVGAALEDNPRIAAIAVVALLVIAEADDAEPAQLGDIGRDLVRLIEAFRLDLLGPALQGDRSLAAKNLQAGQRELSLSELPRIAIIERLDFGQLERPRCRDEPEGLLRLIEQLARRDHAAGILGVRAADEHRAAEPLLLERRGDPLEDRHLFLEGERHGAPKRAGGAGEAAVRGREDQAVRLLGDQYAERVGPMRVHPDGDQGAMAAHGPEGDQHQVAPGLQVEFDLPAGHLVQAARGERVDG